MIFKGLFPIILLAFLSACASLGKTTKEPTQFSAADYPYIEKFHEGVRLKARGQVDDAISLFEQCILLRQDDDAPYYALSQLYLIKNDLKKSAEFIQVAADLDPTNIWYTQEMAYMFFEQENFQESLKNFEKLVKNQPNNVDWLYGYAECLVKVGKTAEAIKALDKTEDQVGKHPELTLQKFKLYVEIKQPEKGIEEIELVRKQFPNDPQLIATLVDYYFQIGKEEKATMMLEELVRTAPENGRAHLALADIYRQKGNQTKAYQELKEAFICEDVTIDTKMKILINVHESSFKIDPEIYELVELMVSQYPDEAKAHSIRGDFMLKAEKEDEALISYKEALKYDKNQYPIWNQVMIMEYKKGNFADLFEDSKACLEYFPTIPTVYLLNGLSAVQLKKYETAVSVLAAGKDMVVNDKSLEAEIYAQLGEAYFGLKNLNLGKENFEKAMVLDPKSALVRNNYAYRLALAKADLERATILIDQILVENSEVAHFVDTKGFILFQQGNYKEAMVYFEKAFKLKALDKIIVEHMGDGSMKLGEKEKAIEYWIKAKELGSTNLNLNKKIEKKEFYEPLY